MNYVDTWAPENSAALEAAVTRCEAEVIQLGELVGSGDGAAPLEMLRRVLAKVPARLDRFRQGGSAQIVAAMRDLFKAPPLTDETTAFLTAPLPCTDLPRWSNRWTFLVESSRASAQRAVRGMLSGAKDGSGEFVSPILTMLREFLRARDAGHEPPLCAGRFPQVFEAIAAYGAEYLNDAAPMVEARVDAQLSVLKATATTEAWRIFSEPTGGSPVMILISMARLTDLHQKAIEGPLFACTAINVFSVLDDLLKDLQSAPGGTLETWLVDSSQAIGGGLVQLMQVGLVGLSRDVLNFPSARFCVCLKSNLMFDPTLLSLRLQL